MEAVRVSPEWFTAAWKNLELIEANAPAYADAECGDKAPPKEVFDAVRTFFTALRNTSIPKLEQPRISVSPHGQIVLTYGNQTRTMVVRFAPCLSYYFNHADQGPVKGDCMNDAVDLVSRYFGIS